ncbi:hypothetical protein JCM9957A_17900 [Kineosporia succinea]
MVYAVITFVMLAIGTATVPSRRLPIVPTPGTTRRALPFTGQVTLGVPPGTAPLCGTSHSIVGAALPMVDVVVGATGPPGPVRAKVRLRTTVWNSMTSAPPGAC